MNIRLTSSLTAEDENYVAPALLKALTCILDLFPIAYALRIDTSDAMVYEHGSSPGRTLDSGDSPTPITLPPTGSDEA